MRVAITHFWVCFVAVSLAILGANLAVAQNANTGEIRGTVQDSSGALIEGVKVTIANVDTGVNTVSTTNSAGLYDAPSVAPGQYVITFSKAGFKEFVRKGVTLPVQTIAVDATLQVGNVAEQVTIVAEAPILQTETSDQQTNFSTREVLAAPITGGVWFSELTKVLPGVGGGGGRNASGGEGVAVNGTQSYSANFQIEGSSATDPRDQNASDNYPPIDAIGEVNVNAASGAQSGNSLLSLNVNLKSGTNRWHGSLFEFVQNDLFNSRNYFQNTGKKAVERWNEFGGSVGGPIVKDKLFFYFTYQRNPVQSGTFRTTTVPTMAMRSGDFSTLDGQGNPLFPTIYDSTSCSGFCNRTALNGGTNVLLPTQIDPVAMAILNYFPNPTDTDNTHLVSNFSAVVATPSLGQWYVGKIDYQLSPKHRLSGSILEYPITLTFSPDALCGLGFDCTTSTPNNRNQTARITETWTVSSTAVNEFRINGMREHDQYAGKTFGKGYLQKLGIEPAYGSNAPVDAFPNITVSAIGNNQLGVASQTFIGGGVHANLVEDIVTGSDVVTLIRGKHTVRIGGELDRQFQHDTTWGDASSGDFTFNGVGSNSGTSIDPRTGGSSVGVPLADFLLGQVGTWNIYNGEPTNTATWITGVFANDDFKLTPHLTLNLGLRYQHQTGWSVADGRFANFNPTLANPAIQTSWYPSVCTTACFGAMQYGQINGHNTIEPSANSWSPRIGFAWAPRDKWSFRGSYGVFQVARGSELYAHDNFPGTLGFGFNPHGSIFPNSSDNVVAFPLQTGPTPGSVIFPTAANLTPDQFNYGQVAYYAPHIPLQYLQQFLLSVQRELPAHHVLDVSYVHTKGTHLNFATDINQVPGADLANGGDYSSSRPVPWFRSILGHDFTGWSNYDALQVRLVKQMSYGLSYQFNYTWSKMLDTGTSSGHDQGLDYWQIARNPALNYGISQLDAPQNFNGSITYELPFGTGRMMALHGVLNQIAGGWRLSGIVQAHSGAPFTPIVAEGSTDFANAGSINCFCGYSLYPNRVGNGKLSNPTLSRWFDVSAFTNPSADGPAFGNSGRNILRGPRLVNFDLSMAKSFRIRESMNLEIRADSYNFFNHPQFNNPDNNILDGQAGQITSGQGANNFGPGRLFQLGGRFTF